MQVPSTNDGLYKEQSIGSGKDVARLNDASYDDAPHAGPNSIQDNLRRETGDAGLSLDPRLNDWLAHSSVEKVTPKTQTSNQKPCALIEANLIASAATKCTNEVASVASKAQQLQGAGIQRETPENMRAWLRDQNDALPHWLSYGGPNRSEQSNIRQGPSQ